MRLNRGCSCFVFVLAATNVMLFAGAIIAVVNKTTSLLPAGLFMMAVFAANVAVCLMMGLTSVRARRIFTSTASAEGEDESQDANTDVASDVAVTEDEDQ
jgi:hypothetical protein